MGRRRRSQAPVDILPTILEDAVFAVEPAVPARRAVQEYNQLTVPPTLARRLYNESSSLLNLTPCGKPEQLPLCLQHPANIRYGLPLGSNNESRDKHFFQEDLVALLRVINETRKEEQQPPLELSLTLCQRSQSFADFLSTISYTYEPSGCLGIPTTIKEFRGSTGAARVRFITPPGMGALAVGLMWQNGKFKKGQCGRHKGAKAEEHTKGPCYLFRVYNVLTSREWVKMGVGKEKRKDGRWVVDLSAK